MENSEVTIKEGYKQTDVGIIPEDWKVKAFGDVTDVITCGVAATPEYVNGGVGKPFLSAQNIRNGKVVYDNHKYISKELFDQITKHNKPEKGDLLYTRVGAGIGEAGVIEDDYVFAIYVSLTLIKTDKRQLFSYFLLHLLNSPRYKFLAKNTQFAGGGVQNLNVQVVREFQIPLPPLPEQQAIAEVLSDVDALITSLDALLTKKRNIKQGTMQLLLTGKKRLPGFSGDWETKKLGEIFDIFAGGDFIPKLSSEIKDEKHPYPIYSNSVSDKGLYGFSSYYIYKENALTVTARGTLGVANFRNHKFTAIGRVLVMYPKKSTDCFYVSEFINNRVDFVVESTGVPQLTAPQISSYQILLPPFPEQKAIAQILSEMDAEIEALEAKREKYQAIKQGMMQELLTGKTRLV